MRVLFLDIDGVLNDSDFIHHSKYPHLDTLDHLNPECITHLNTIVDRTDCVIVISSTWRILHSLEHIVSLLSEKGFRHPARIIDMTDTDRGIRGQQIHRWLLAHQGLVAGMCILDDDSDMDPYMPWLIKTNFFDGGLTGDHVGPVVDCLFELFEPQNKVQSPV